MTDNKDKAPATLREAVERVLGDMHKVQFMDCDTIRECTEKKIEWLASLTAALTLPDVPADDADFNHMLRMFYYDLDQTPRRVYKDVDGTLINQPLPDAPAPGGIDPAKVRQVLDAVCKDPLDRLERGVDGLVEIKDMLTALLDGAGAQEPMVPVSVVDEAICESRQHLVKGKNGGYYVRIRDLRRWLNPYRQPAPPADLPAGTGAHAAHIVDDDIAARVKADLRPVTTEDRAAWWLATEKFADAPIEELLGGIVATFAGHNDAEVRRWRDAQDAEGVQGDG